MGRHRHPRYRHPRWCLAATLAAVVTTTVACTGAVDDPVPSAPTTATPTTTSAATDGECLLDDAAVDCVAWSVEDATVATADARQVVLGIGREVVALGPVDGDELWRVAAPEGELASLQVVGDAVVVTSLPGDGTARTTVLDRADGSQRWSRPGAPARVPTDATSVALIAPDAATTRIVDVADGTVSWTATVSGPFGVAPFGDVALVDDGSGVTLADATTGEPRWRTDGVVLSDTMAFHAGPLGAVVAAREPPDASGSSGDRPVLLAAADGAVVAPSPSLDPSWVLETVDGQVIATDLTTTTLGLAPDGGERWRIAGTPVVSRDGRHLLVRAEQDGREGLVLLDPVDGARLWQLLADSDVLDLVVADGVAALTRLGSVTLHDLTTGEVRDVVRGRDVEVVSLAPLVVRSGGTVSALDLG